MKNRGADTDGALDGARHDTETALTSASRRGGVRGDRAPKRRKFEPNDPHAEGYEAAATNKLRASNPYTLHSDDARRWNEGYSEFVESDGQFAD